MGCRRYVHNRDGEGDCSEVHVHHKVQCGAGLVARAAAAKGCKQLGATRIPERGAPNGAEEDLGSVEASIGAAELCSVAPLMRSLPLLRLAPVSRTPR